MATKQYFFYVLYCADHTLYTGYTVDLEARTASHNAGKGAKYTQQAKRRPVRLLYAEERPSRSLAMRAEARFKRLTRAQKEDYLFCHGCLFPLFKGEMFSSAFGRKVVFGYAVDRKSVV